MSDEKITHPYVGATDADAYEWLNRCTDPDGRLQDTMAGLASWKGRTLLDLGAGSGYQAVQFAESATRVFAVEPDGFSRVLGGDPGSRPGSLLSLSPRALPPDPASARLRSRDLREGIPPAVGRPSGSASISPGGNLQSQSVWSRGEST